MSLTSTSLDFSLSFVLFCAVKPRIDRTNLKALAVRAGKPIFFDVNVKGEPAPKVQWFRKWKNEEKEVSGSICLFLSVYEIL